MTDSNIRGIGTKPAVLLRFDFGSKPNDPGDKLEFVAEVGMMTEKEAIRIAKAFAKSNGIPWLSPVGTHRSKFRKRGWIWMLSRSRDVWVVGTASNRLGGGSASILVDEKTGHVLKYDVYTE